MSRPIEVTLSMAAAVADGICLSQTPAAGGVQSLTINGSLASGGIATMDTSRHVSITSTGNDSARTFTVIGTDRFGNSVSKQIAGPNTTTVKLATNLKTVTGVTVDGNTAGAITVGSADEAETQWIPLNHHVTPFEVGIGVEMVNSANLTYGAQFAFDNIQADGFQENDAQAFDHATITAKTAAFSGSQTTPVRAIRFAVTGHVVGGITARLIQSG